MNKETIEVGNWFLDLKGTNYLNIWKTTVNGKNTTITNIILSKAQALKVSNKIKEMI